VTFGWIPLWLATFLDNANEHHLGDLSGILGILISFVGFGLTIYNVSKSKSAARAATVAARDIRRSIQLYDALADISAAVVYLEEIKTLQRSKNWLLLLDRYGALRKRLITVRERNPYIRDDHRTKIQAAMTTLAQLEKSVDTALSHGRQPEGVRSYLLSTNVDELHSMLIELQSNASSDEDGK
jgi:hypothetical protein